MKILFIGHDAHRAGAQLLLLQFLQWIKTNRIDIDFEILLTRGGDLVTDYSETGKVTIFQYNTNNNSFKSKIKRQLKRRLLLRKLSIQKFDIIYSNTIVNGEVLNVIKELNLPIITHVHELDYWISKAGERNLHLVKSSTNKYIVASDSVKNCLINSYNFASNDLYKINEFVLFNKLGKDKKSIINKLKLPENSIIIGSSGAEIWRKGKDWFIPLAIEILSRETENNIHFVWIGGELNYELNNDFEKSGFSDNIHFIPHLPNANQYFHEFSVFAMLSREDPFPVVNLEAAGLGVPIVCFDKSGGTPELISEGCGYVVPYGNIHAFADKVMLLIENKQLRDEIGNKAKEIISQKYDINIIANKMIDVIQTVKN